MKYVVDTNVPLVANGIASHVSPQCALSCVRKLREIRDQHVVVLDDRWLIIGEYRKRLRSSGEPGVGDEFLKWILTNRDNPMRCEWVPLSCSKDAGGCDFDVFPPDLDLATFDRSDRKFVAVALTHPQSPPILNAADSDWWMHRCALARHGVRVEFLCLDAAFMEGE